MNIENIHTNKRNPFSLLKWVANKWRNLPLGIKGIGVIALPLLVLLASLASLYFWEQQSAVLENKLRLAMQNQKDIQTVHTQLLEASTGVRDYLLTGDKHFLEIFFKVEKNLPQKLSALHDQLEDQAQRYRLASIAPLVEQNLHDLRILSKHESEVASESLIAKFKSQVSTLDRLRLEIEKLNTEESLLVAKDQQEVLKQRQNNISMTLLAALAGIIGSVLAVWIYSLTIVKRVRLLRDSAGHLAKAEPLELPFGSSDELGQLSDELEHASQLLAKNISETLQARKEAEEANAAKSMFLSRTSHELRTPLNAILGFAQLLEEDLPPSKLRDNASLILGAGQHLLKLINEVLEIARIESGELAPELSAIAVNPLLEEATHYIAPIGKIRDITIISNVAPDLWARANRQKLLQVILNLLSNALKYGPASSQVSLNAYQKRNSIIIEVRDEGKGIPPELRDRLFTPFDRLGAEHTKIEGIGLGLALSKQIMHVMQGSIHVADNESLFWIEIPACAAGTATHPHYIEARSKPMLASGDKHSILYVEDNVSNRTLVEAIIQRQRDLRIYCVATIKDAKRFLGEMSPSLILVDLDLPDGSGETLVSYIQSTPTLRDIPIMILSADALPETVERLKQAGVAEYMTKPFDVAIFSKTVRELIGI